MMKSYGLLGLIGCLSLSAVLTLPARAEVTPQVFLSEINWAGSEKSTADEWLELMNLGTTSVDLSHYVLTGVATGGGAIEIAEGTHLAPGHTLIIANYALGDTKTTLLTSPDLVTAAVSLPNSNINILLADPTGLVIDSYTDSGAPEFGAANPATSIERDLLTMSWRSAGQRNNLSSTTQLGTPGSAVLPAAPEPAAPAVVTEPVPEIVTPAPEPIVPEPVTEPSAPTEVVIPASVEPVTVQTNPVDLPEPCTPVVLEKVTPTPTESSSLAETATQATSWPTAPTSASEVIEIPSTPGSLLPSGQAPSTSPEPSNTSRIQEIAPGSLIVNELVSDPTDSIEWVELLNVSSQSLDLSGSTLEDAGAHTTELPETTLAPDAFLIIENPTGNLNNSGDTLSVFDAYGTLLDTMTYGTAAIPSPKDGESVARDADGKWLITEATQNATNIFPETAVIDVETSSSSNSGSLLSSGQASSIHETENTSTTTYATTTDQSDSPLSDPGTTPGPVEAVNNSGSPATEPVHRIVAIAKSVTGQDAAQTTGSTKTKKAATPTTVITGTVVALPDTFGKQILYLDGHEIYFNTADWPELQVGDVVQVTGTLATTNGAERLKIKTRDDIVVTGHVTVTPAPIDGVELATTPHGALVSVSGRVIGKVGDKVSLKAEDGTVMTIVAHKKTGVTWSAMQSGTAIMTGVVRVTADGPRVYIRSLDDIHFTPDATIQAPAGTKTKTSKTPIVGGGLLTGSVGALGTWYLRSRKGLLGWLPI